MRARHRSPPGSLVPVRTRPTPHDKTDNNEYAKLPGRYSGGVIEGRLQRRGLELSGNPVKFVQGHNLFGSSDPSYALDAALRKIVGSMLPGPQIAERFSFNIDAARISRIDLTASWTLPREGDVLPFLRAMEERVWCPYRGRGVQSDPGTLYYGLAQKGKRAKDWQLKIYSKGMEVGRRPLPSFAMEVPGLLDEVNRTVRVELTLRTRELKRLGLRCVGDWTPEKVGEVWRAYVDRLDFGEIGMNLDNTDLAELGLRPRLLDAISSWKAGNDMRAGRSKAAFYKLRNDVREATGYDIASPVPKSNVVPLRRVIEAKPALYPIWADQLTAALERVA
ncbi:phage/plasmid replication protein, II/X family [Novosphingobium sp. P6W]|uniref:phage/plasmid replication protein, II/X family n=1 Tax=Novosphingobium sp. P6W TaxID=1609758 RepID=UPI000A78F4D2|nr:phage/plasmid replication protein, II/X family [Novosphingobium sp. P6W]